MLPPGADEDVYLPHEIAKAAGVPLEQVVAAVGGDEIFVAYGPAVRLGRRLAGLTAPEGLRPRPLFTAFYASPTNVRADPQLPVLVTGALHAILIAAAAVLTAAGQMSSAATLQRPVPTSEEIRLVFLAEPGPGGGGGGGGLKQLAIPTRAATRGRQFIGNPIERRLPVAVESPALPPPLAAEPFPVVVAPIAPAAASPRIRLGTVDGAEAPVEVHGAGSDGGGGTGSGSGVGTGRGAGLGDGIGGGTGGGVFRAGSGVEPPRVVHEVKADYPDEARRRAIEGEVVVELVVRRDGSVGEARVVHRLNAALDERALQAVRQWRFEPGKYRGSPVDVAVEVVVEFRLR